MYLMGKWAQPSSPEPARWPPRPRPRRPGQGRHPARFPLKRSPPPGHQSLGVRSGRQPPARLAGDLVRPSMPGRLLSWCNLPQTADWHIAKSSGPSPGFEASSCRNDPALLAKGVTGPDAVESKPGFEAFERSLAGTANRPDPILRRRRLRHCPGIDRQRVGGLPCRPRFLVPAAVRKRRPRSSTAPLRQGPDSSRLAISTTAGAGWTSAGRSRPRRRRGRDRQGHSARDPYGPSTWAGRAFDLAGSRPEVFIGQGPLWERGPPPGRHRLSFVHRAGDARQLHQRRGPPSKLGRNLPPPENPGRLVDHGRPGPGARAQGIPLRCGADVADEVRARFGRGEHSSASPADHPVQGFLSLPASGRRWERTPTIPSCSRSYLARSLPRP